MKEIATTKNIVFIGMFTALISLGAFISLPIGPVAITLQSFFVLLSAYFLKKRAVYATLAYTIIGLIGLPVFSGFTGGVFSIFKASFGFIVGMNIAAYIMGNIFNNLKNKGFIKVATVFLFGSIIIYLVGLPYMAFVLNVYLKNGLTLTDILTKGMLIFLPGDIIKVIIAGLIVSKENIKNFV